jgi:hypothetical protein
LQGLVLLYALAVLDPPEPPEKARLRDIEAVWVTMRAEAA